MYLTHGPILSNVNASTRENDESHEERTNIDRFLFTTCLHPENLFLHETFPNINLLLLHISSLIVI